MATRTSSPPRKRPSGSQARKKPAQKRKPQTRKPAARRPAARRTGPGPIAAVFNALLRASTAMWLGIAGLVGAIARSIGHSAKDLDPEQRRDGVGFGILGLAVVVAGAVWSDMPGAIGNVVRDATAGASASWRGLSRSCSSWSPGARCAIPTATDPPVVRSSAGPRSAAASSGSCTSPTTCRAQVTPTPTRCERPAERSASCSPRSRWTCSRAPTSCRRSWCSSSSSACWS